MEVLKGLSKKLASPGVQQQFLKLNRYVRAPPDPCNPNLGTNKSGMKTPLVRVKFIARQKKDAERPTKKQLAPLESPANKRQITKAKSVARKSLRAKGRRHIGMKKFANRISPLESATAYPVETRKVGLNGKLWVVAANKKGIHRWTPFSV